MVRFLEKFMYARQWLNNSNKIIFANGTPLITPLEQTIYENAEPHIPSIIVGNEIPVERKVISFGRDYKKLRSRGLCIIAVPVKNPKHKGQISEYYVVRETFDTKGLLDVPKGHSLLYDIKNSSYKVEGPNAGDKWFNPRKKSVSLFAGYDPLSSNDVLRNADVLMNSYRAFPVKREKRKDIHHLPVLLTHDGRILCIPLKGEANEPTVTITGIKGKGKSFLKNSILSRAYNYGKLCADLNDISNEMGVCCLPWEKDSTFTKQLSYLNMNTIPLPCVYLLPNNKELKHVDKEKMQYRISYPFKQALMKPKSFFTGSEGWNLGKSARYLEPNLSELMTCKSLKDIDEVLKKDDNMPKPSKGVIRTVMKNGFNSQIFDVNTDIPSEWVVKEDVDGEVVSEKSFSPIIACLYSELVPVIRTSHIHNENYFPQIVQYNVEEIFRVQTEDKYFVENQLQIWCFVDEFGAIVKKRKENLASYILQQLVTTGRPKRIGTVYVNQNYSNLSDTVQTNTNYAFALGQFSKEAKVISSDFNLDKNEEKQLINLSEFEVMALTKDKFILVDPTDGSEEVVGSPGIIPGRAFPPLCQHKIPRTKNV